MVPNCQLLVGSPYVFYCIAQSRRPLQPKPTVKSSGKQSKPRRVQDGRSSQSFLPKAINIIHVSINIHQDTRMQSFDCECLGGGGSGLSQGSKRFRRISSTQVQQGKFSISVSKKEGQSSDAAQATNSSEIWQHVQVAGNIICQGWGRSCSSLVHVECDGTWAL